MTGRPVWDVAFSPDGKTLSAGYRSGGSGGVMLWDLGKREPLRNPLPVKEGEVWDVAFSPDGEILAVGYGVVGGVDGKTLSGGGGGVALWDLATRDRPMAPECWRRIAGEIANRNFTQDEWQQYFPDKPYQPTFSWLPDLSKVAANDGARNQ
jgi:WD40 repeat protein